MSIFQSTTCLSDGSDQLQVCQEKFVLILKNSYWHNTAKLHSVYIIQNVFTLKLSRFFLQRITGQDDTFSFEVQVRMYLVKLD